LLELVFRQSQTLVLIMIGFRKKLKKSNRSFAEVVKTNGFDHRSSIVACSSRPRSVFSRLNFSSVPDLNLQPRSTSGSSYSCSSSQRKFGKQQEIFRRVSNSNEPPVCFLSGANLVPLGHSRLNL
jgi:hypothetical protein